MNKKTDNFSLSKCLQGLVDKTPEPGGGHDAAHLQAPAQVSHTTRVGWSEPLNSSTSAEQTFPVVSNTTKLHPLRKRTLRFDVAQHMTTNARCQPSSLFKRHCSLGSISHSCASSSLRSTNMPPSIHLAHENLSPNASKVSRSSCSEIISKSTSHHRFSRSHRRLSIQPACSYAPQVG